MPKNSAKRIDEVALVEDAHLDQQLAQATTRVRLELQGLLDLGMGDQAA